MAASACSPIPSLQSHRHFRSYAFPCRASHPCELPILFASVPAPGFRRRCLARAKFEKFTAADVGNDSVVVGADEPSPAELEGDSCLPSDLQGAVRQSGKASADFVAAGGMRAIVELLIPQLEFLNAEGAQAAVWESARIFLDTLAQETGQKVKGIFPDAGVAALLKYQWTDANFGCSSLSDRVAVDTGDEVAVMIIPDHQMLEYVERIASRLADDPPRPLIMWNPRLVSGDVGVGFNVRNLRKNFLSTFTTVYSMRPLPSGAVFRCYPGMWKVFRDDSDRPNRYLLAKELPSRPSSTDIDMIFGDLSEETGDGPPSMLASAMGMLNSFSRFMKAISR